MTIITLPCLLRGGTEFQTLQLVKALKKLNQEVMVLVYFEVEEDMVQLFENENIIVKCLHWQRAIKPVQFVIKLKRILKKIQPKIVHVQYMTPGMLPILAAKLAGVPRIIATVHQPYTKSHGWKAQFLLRFSALFCKQFLAVSQNAEISWFGSSNLIKTNTPITQQNKHLTFYNTVNVQKIQSIALNLNKKEAVQKMGLNDKIIVGTVSRMRDEKGIDLLIEAYALLKPNNPTIHLLLVGDGPDIEKYKNLVKQRKIEESVIFMGDVNWNKAIEIMSIMNIVVIPSRFEGFGLSAAEAMALQKPIVAADNFGLKELITHQKEGLLFENENFVELSKKIELLLNNEANAKNYANKAYLKVKKTFDTLIFEENTKTLYQLN